MKQHEKHLVDLYMQNWELFGFIWGHKILGTYTWVVVHYSVSWFMKFHAENWNLIHNIEWNENHLWNYFNHLFERPSLHGEIVLRVRSVLDFLEISRYFSTTVFLMAHIFKISSISVQYKSESLKWSGFKL